jgi:hypothetical protein
MHLTCIGRGKMKALAFLVLLSAVGCSSGSAAKSPGASDDGSGDSGQESGAPSADAGGAGAEAGDGATPERPSDAGVACLATTSIDLASLSPYWVNESTACGTATFSSGGLAMTYDPCGTPFQGGQVNLDDTQWQVCGDFDVQVAFDVTFPAQSGGVERWAVLRAYDGSTPDGVAAELFQGPVTSCLPAIDDYQFWSTNSSTDPATCSTINIPTTDTSGKLRVTRSGSTVTSYYWDTAGDAGGEWAEIGSRDRHDDEPVAATAEHGWRRDGTGGEPKLWAKPERHVLGIDDSVRQYPVSVSWRRPRR